MSYLVPVFFLPVAFEDRWLADPEAAALALIGEAAGDREASGLRQATSTNWWHAVLAQRLAAAWHIEGLEFLRDTVRFLSGDDLRAVSVAVEGLFAKLTRESSPPTSLTAEQLEGIRFQDLRDGVASATASAVVDEATGDVHSFLQFLLSMRAAAEDARKSGRHLLYYKTHP